MSGGRRLFVAAALVAAFLLGAPRDSRAQAVPAAYGLVSGAVAGVYVTTGVFVAKARAGSYLYSLEDALEPRWELVPLAVLPLGSLAIGLDDGQRLANTVKWGGAGFAAGAVVGLGVGTLLRQSGGESQWAGAIIGSATGLLAGWVYGTLSYEDEAGDGVDLPLLTFRIRL